MNREITKIDQFENKLKQHIAILHYIKESLLNTKDKEIKIYALFMICPILEQFKQRLPTVLYTNSDNIEDQLFQELNNIEDMIYTLDQSVAELPYKLYPHLDNTNDIHTYTFHIMNVMINELREILQD